MTRYRRGYGQVFLEHYGLGPWSCAYCSELVYEIGRRANQGHVHHRNEDKQDNRPENLVMMHCRCHRQHHMIGTRASTKHREAISRGLRGHEVSVKTRQKIGDANRGHQRGHPHSDKARAKMRQARLRDRKRCDLCDFESNSGFVAVHRRKVHQAGAS